MQFSCDKQSNPFIGDDPIFYLENMMGESRDILVLEDISFDVFTCGDLEEQVCIDDIWCEWNDSCEGVTNDLLIVANQYEEGLIIYDINTIDDEIRLNKIYQNNNFEIIDATSTENDLELRHLIYSEDSQMLYILDKFEYIYNGWLPTLLENSTNSYNANCFDLSEDGVWDPIVTSFFSIPNLHSTHIVIDESDIGNFDEALVLLKYNEEISSESTLPDPIQTSCSIFGSYYFQVPITSSLACDGVFITGSQSKISPLFDYDVSDVYFYNNKVFIANPYSNFIFRDALNNDIDITYYEGVVQNGCDLPKNSISFSEQGELYYNLESNVSYFEFNLIHTDLSKYYITNMICNEYVDVFDNYREYTANCFQGIINNLDDFSISISGNKVIGYTSSTGEVINAQCGTLIDLEINANDLAQIVHDGIYFFSIYEYSSFNELISFNDDVQTISKVNSIYSVGNSILTGLIDGGCYITLLGERSTTMTKLGGDSFTVNDIYYDEDNNMLFLSCGSDGILVYEWFVGNTSASFINHIISSYAYTARLYISDEDDYYVIVATKYGLEIYKL